MSTAPGPTACRAPTVSLNLDPLGAVRACCMSPWYVLGRIGEARLGDIWTGERARSLRDRLAVDDLSAGCDACREPLESGIAPRAFARTFDDLPLVEPPHDPQWPAQLELALSNRCNLQCVMCNGTLSSAIRAGREGLAPLASVYDDQFFDDLRPFLAQVQRVALLGGEPFLARETWRVVDILRSLDRRPRLQVTTNGTVWTPRVERLLDEFPTDVVVSIDAVDADTMTSIRVGVDPSAVWRNLDRFRTAAARSGGSTAVAHCLMVDNWRELHALLRRGDELDLDVFINEVAWPTNHTLGALAPADLRDLIVELERQGSAGPELQRNREVWTGTLRRLRSAVRGAGTPVELSARPGDAEAGTVHLLVDHRQVLVGVTPWPADVFGVDLTAVIGHPVGEWMAHFQSVHGDLDRSELVRRPGGVERWTLDLVAPAGRRRLEATYAPRLDGSGVWSLRLHRSERG